ncbi:MAG: GAF domain-containing protein, partial [Candidatus Electrothrix sp. AR3]|nr:GAF domain-containing protein [Candidatus Electrothrix sp. AR3]
YRNNEVNSNHPFIITLEKLKNANVIINTIVLKNLRKKNVLQLLQDSIRGKGNNLKSLNELIFQKTHGNAFFTHQFLQTLYSDTLLRFDIKQYQWQWDIEQIEAQNITENVVDLMTKKIDQLSDDTSELLQLAACIGNQFDLSILAIIYEQGRHKTLSVLWDALVEGLIQPLDDNYKHLDTVETSSFKFLHDRVQQAAYALIDDERKQAVHLQIGRLLRKNTSLDQLEDNIFDIAEQFNHSLQLITHPAERIAIAQLNLKAGQKAKLAMAYGAAVNYLQLGLKCLNEKHWQTEYDLVLDLYKESIESNFLNGNFEQTKQLAQTVLQQATILLDKIRVFEILIQLHMTKNQTQTALDTALQVLEMLEIDLAKKPPLQLVITDYYTLQEMTAPKQVAAMRILNFAISPSYIAAPKLFPQIVFTMVKLSVKYGNSALSAFGYTAYASLLCAAFDIESGYQAGQLGISLLKKFDAKALKAKVFASYNVTVHHWKRHAQESIAPLKEGSQSGLETGDVEFTGINLMHCGSYLFWLGKPLATVAQQQKEFHRLMRSLNLEYQLIYLTIWQQSVSNLQGTNTDPCRLIGKFFNEEELLAKILKENYGMAIFAIYLAKAMLCYLFKDFNGAVSNAALAEKYEQSNVGVMVVPIQKFYYSLALLAIYPLAPAKKQADIIIQVESYQEQMKIWAHHAPSNYRHRYKLVEAEKARVFGQHWIAAKLYEEAIVFAKKNQYIQEEGLSYELAAEFYLASGMEKFFKTYLREALYSYQQWGATAKVVALKKKYPQVFVENLSLASTTISNVRSSLLQSSNHFDLTSVMKAAQALAGEIILRKLLAKMMRIVIENAGAERGVLLLPLKNKWVIETEGHIENDEVRVLQSLAIEDHSHVPTTLIHYVARTQESVVLSGAAGKGKFDQDTYIINNNPKSLLALPLLNQGKLTGILYLENNLTTGAFTSERLKVLKLLSSQLAISIENSLLYNNLEQKV